MCKQSDLESPAFQVWIRQLYENPEQIHRKLWEWCYIAQALYERGMIADGKKGIGFAVGKEPLIAMLAKYGCKILATDQFLDQVEAGWVKTNQHCSGLNELNPKNICEPDVFKRNVAFLPVDMNHIPFYLQSFDFCWSACAFEHLGSISLGKQFIYNMMECLKPGGVAIHTSEYNVGSNDDTIDNTNCVIFRRKDYEEMAEVLSSKGHQIELDFTEGNKRWDLHVDKPPYSGGPHLKLKIDKYISTSFGLIITK